MRDVPTGRTPRVPDPERYDIRVTGHFAGRWATWFDGMTLSPQDDGTTIIRGPVADQSALHGLLRKLSDIGLSLISVTPTAGEAAIDRTTDASGPTVALDHHPRRSST